MPSAVSATPPSGPATAARVLGRLTSTVAHRLLETVRRESPISLAEVPSSASTITADWLTSALCRDVPKAHVVGIETTGTTSQTTSRANLLVHYNAAGRAAGLPEQVFVKLTATVRQRLFLGLIRCVEGEPLFYRELRPLLDLECPQGYYGAIDHRSWRSIVVIEDIAATRGASFCHATSDISRADIESLVDVMADYHGAMWESPLVTGAPWLKRPIDHFHNTSAFLNMRKRCAVGIERAGEVMPPAVRADPDGLWTAFLASMRAFSEGPTTLLHGDPHIGNTYRTAAGAMSFTDWQVCMQGSWAFDYAYAVSTALTVENRRAWERDLLDRYLERLAQGGGEPPEFDDAFRAYRQGLLYPLHTWTTVIGRSALQPLMQSEDVCRLIIERVSHAIEDLDAVGSAA